MSSATQFTFNLVDELRHNLPIEGIVLCCAYWLLESSYAAEGLLDDVCGGWPHRGLGIAVLVGRFRHDPDWHGQLVDRLPQ